MPRFGHISGFVILLAAQVSCSSQSRAPRLTPEAQEGTFRFSERARGSGVVIDVAGEFTITADTIMARVADRSCRPRVPPDTRSYLFDCGDVSLAFDRVEPLRRPRYSAIGIVMVEERVCREQVQDRFGVQRCAGYITQRVPRERSFHGELHPRPMP
jgi:hypothetical protein